VIGKLSGTLLEKRPPMIMVDVNGVAYELDVPMTTLYQLPATGGKVTLYTHLIVREDAHLLFGFASEAERQAFRQLLKVNGVGARTALAVLSGLSVRELSQAISSQDAALLLRIPGVGRKTAERLLLELKDKLQPASVESGAAAVPGSSRGDVLNALISLGYSEKEANSAVARLAPELGVPEAIRQALKQLSKVGG
jgi:Holliday junction DNA helicase RuvA